MQRYLNDEPVQACPPSAWYRFRKFARRNRRAVVTAAAVALAVVLAVAGLATSTLLIAREQRATANALRAETRAKDDLRRDAYFHRIALAHRELSVDNLGRALELLDECPEDLREWEWHYLMRLCRVEPLVLRDKTEVNSVAFSPDGERLASAGGDGAVKVWNSRTGKVIQTLANAHAGSVVQRRVPPRRQAPGLRRRGPAGEGLGLDDRPGRCSTARATPFTSSGRRMPWRSVPDGRQLAAGSDGAVKVWDWKNRSAPAHLPRTRKASDQRGVQPRRAAPGVGELERGA